MRHLRRDDGVDGGLERLVRRVLVHAEDALEHIGEAEPPAEGLQLLDAARRHPERRPRRRIPASLEIHRAPDPRHEISPVIEVKVRDHDRVDLRPAVPRAQPREHARTAVEQNGSRSVDEVAGLRAPGVRPGRGAAHDCELHPHILADGPCFMLTRMATAPVELIKRVPLFADLDNRELKEIAESMKERTFRAGDTVTEEGKGGVGFFVIDDGTAKVSVGGQDVRTLGAGDYFGEIGLIADVDRTATITAESELRCYGM